MKRAQLGSTVTVQYVGTLDNGKIFDSNSDEEPLEFIIGSNQVFPALEQGVIGMAVGEVRNIVLKAVEAYGPRRQENLLTISRSRFPADKPLVIGQKLSIEFSGGQARVMQITEITEESVTMDGNHPLVGLDLTFALRLDRIC
jgi:FKBP-type peptidyl-prolyl cis-trans isomerase 2